MGREVRDTPVETPICKRHKKYSGLRSPRTECEICASVYDFAKRSGVKETRKGKNSGSNVALPA